MRNNKRPTSTEPIETDPKSEEPVDDKVSFYDTLDAETRAQVDEVLELSKALARNVVTALNRGETPR